MSLDEVIEALKSAKTPSRNLDVAVATATGWRIGVGRSDQGRSTKVWVSPTSQKVDRVPFYTSDLQHALDLVRSIAPDQKSGCSWEENGTGNAKIGNGPFFQASTPAIALCIAALDWVMREQVK